MSTQKALLLPVKNGDWRVGEIAIPTPGPNDVLVKIISTALNPRDWKIREFDGLIPGLPSPEYPAVLGLDAAGIVEQAGSSVTNLAKGDKILYLGALKNPAGTFQQYSIVPAELTAKIPNNISFDQAASIPLGIVTPATVLYSHDAPAENSLSFPAPWEEDGLTRFSGKPALIIGGAASIGQFAIQLARLSKFAPIITTASPHNEEFLKSIGATHVLDRSLSRSAALAEIQNITGGAPIVFTFDSVSSVDTQALAYEALPPGGNLAIVLGDQVPAELKKEGDGKKIVRAFGSVHVPTNRKLGVELFKRLTEWLESGAIVPSRVEVIPNGLAGIPTGLQLLKENKVSGKKVVVHPQEPPLA